VKLLPRVIFMGISAALTVLVCGYAVAPVHSSMPALVVTAAPVYQPLAALRGGERFPGGAQLMLMRDGRTTPLMEGFAETADANVSFDGKKLLFAGKENAGDHWAVWEFTFGDRSVRKVISGDSDVIRPLYLPGDRLTFARRIGRRFELEAAGLDGSNILALAYMAASAVPETVLADGRILFQAGFPLGTDVEHGAVPELFLVYSDGSGVESYRCDHGTPRWGGTQLASGDVVFTHGATLARFTSSLAAERPTSAPRANYAGTVVENESGEWLVSARSAVDTHYAVKRWKPGAPQLENLVSRAGEDLVEPVLLAPRTRPNHHPAALHKWDYANVLALDVRQSRDGALKGVPVKVRLDVLEKNGNVMTVGTTPVESDGSFFASVPADRPIQFNLIDEKGTVLRKENGWFWMRKGEQRYCVGCHAGPEHAPENRVPAVLLRTTNPADLTGLDRQPSRGGQ
jgi:hypothetical protein